MGWKHLFLIGCAASIALLWSCDGCEGEGVDSSLCASEDPPPECDIDCSDGTLCPSGFYCSSTGSCAADCLSDRDCGEGASCNDNGVCVADEQTDGGPVGGCSSDEDCAAGLVCHPYGLTCVPAGDTCTDSSECPDEMYCDSSLGVCLKGITGSPCDSDDDCDGSCIEGICGCVGMAHEQELTSGPLDVYLILDRTGSMGRDCDYSYGDSPSARSKACYATYALSDYLIDVEPIVDTRLAFQFMSQPDDCDGEPYLDPLVDLTPLPVSQDHAIIEAIGDETFSGGLGTHIEGALRGLAAYTSANRTPGREMIGVLMTDGDPNGCEERISALRQILADHLAETGIRTFIIGMEGATEENLEELAIAGGADPHDDWCGDLSAPCHYWNVGDGSGDAIASALQAIITMAVPLPCEFDIVGLTPPPGEELDYGRVNVTLTESGVTTTIGWVPSLGDCPTDRAAWYYDDPIAPTQIHLCPFACTRVTEAGDGSRLDIVMGCEDTVLLI